MHTKEQSWFLFSAYTADNKQKVTRTTQGANNPATTGTSGATFVHFEQNGCSRKRLCQTTFSRRLLWKMGFVCLKRPPSRWYFEPSDAGDGSERRELTATSGLLWEASAFYLNQDLDVHQRVGQNRQSRAQYHLTTRVRHLCRDTEARKEVVPSDLPPHGATGVLFLPFITAI